MHINRLVLTIVVVFILASVFGVFINTILLHYDYASVPQLIRRQVDADFRLILLGYLAFAIGSVWIYTHGVEDLPWLGQGVRFGLAMWFVTTLPQWAMAYASQPLPETLLWKFLGLDLIAKLVLGIVTAAMARRP